MPPERGKEVHRQAAPVRRPLPPPGEIRLGDERRIEASQRDEQGVPLHLSCERVNSDERIRRLEVGAGGEDDGVAARTRPAASEHRARQEHQRTASDRRFDVMPLPLC